jgi:type III secretion system (T3SS) SseB-like protein
MSTSTPDDQPIQTTDEAPDAAEVAAAETAARALLTELAASTALLPQSPPAEGEEPPAEDAIALPVIEQDGTHYVPVFTSEDKMRAAGADPETALSVPLAGLAAGWPGEELWLAVDPASEDGLALPPDAVRALPGFLEGAGQTTVG